MVNKYLLFIILLVCLISPSLAVPTTQAATLIGYNNATLNMAGGVAPMWYQYGQLSGSYSWRTENSSTASSLLYGSPLLGNTKFYYRACDGTGCGGELFFTTLQITPQVQTTYGASLRNITNGQFSVEVVQSNILAAYFWLVPTFPAIIWGLLFFAIYIGLWIRERDLVVPVILGLIAGSFVMYADTGLSLGIPVEFQSIAQGLTYAALAGIILGFVKRS
jgi:hypothetical protein